MLGGMADPQHSAEPLPRPSPGGDPGLDRDEVDPLTREISDWLNTLIKAMRASRVYAENNEMHHKFVDRTYEGLSVLLDKVDELSLGVREDRLLHGKDVVHQSTDRQDGLPFVLYRNAFRRLTFLRGMERSELLDLIGAINKDYKVVDYTSEDLVSTLWRLNLAHLRYVTIDAFTFGKTSGTGDLEDAEVDRLQAEIEGIVAAIYQNASPDDDIVAGISIGREDLEALKDVRNEGPEDLARLDVTTERAIADIPPGQLSVVRADIASDDREALTRRMLDILVHILFKEESGVASGATVDLLQQLYDSLLLSQRYGDARGLVVRLREHIHHAEDMKELHMAQHLLKLFASEARIVPVLDALNDGYRSTPITEMVAFLRSLGADVTPVLLSVLGGLDSAAHRKLLCDLIVELGVPPVEDLQSRTSDAKWFVVRDILDLARHHPLARISGMVRSGLEHEHPKVRARALAVLRDYGPGLADELVGHCLADEDEEVRVVAARVAASRRSKSLLPVFEQLIKGDELGDRPLRELRVFLGAYATIGQGSAVRTLAGLLHPSFFARLKNPDLQVAAASALGLVPSESARAALRKGLRSLNSKVREASKIALSQTRRSIVDEEASSVSGPDLAGAVLPAQETGEGMFTFGNQDPSSSGFDRAAHPATQSGPALPIVDLVENNVDEVPDNLPPAPGARPRSEPPAASPASSEMERLAMEFLGVEASPPAASEPPRLEVVSEASEADMASLAFEARKPVLDTGEVFRRAAASSRFPEPAPPEDDEFESRPLSRESLSADDFELEMLDPVSASTPVPAAESDLGPESRAGATPLDPGAFDGLVAEVPPAERADEDSVDLASDLFLDDFGAGRGG